MHSEHRKKPPIDASTRRWLGVSVQIIDPSPPVDVVKADSIITPWDTPVVSTRVLNTNTTINNSPAEHFAASSIGRLSDDNDGDQTIIYKLLEPSLLSISEDEPLNRI